MSYTWASDRWVMPAPYYKTSVVYADLGFDVDYYFLDSNFVDAKPPEDEFGFSFAYIYTYDPVFRPRGPPQWYGSPGSTPKYLRATYSLPMPIPIGGEGGTREGCILYIYIYIYIYIYAYIEENQPYNGYQGPSLILGLRHQVWL